MIMTQPTPSRPVAKGGRAIRPTPAYCALKWSTSSSSGGDPNSRFQRSRSESNCFGREYGMMGARKRLLGEWFLHHTRVCKSDWCEGWAPEGPDYVRPYDALRQ